MISRVSCQKKLGPILDQRPHHREPPDFSIMGRTMPVHVKGVDQLPVVGYEHSVDPVAALARVKAVLVWHARPTPQPLHLVVKED